MDLVESNAGVWTALLLVVCAALSFMVYDQLGTELEVPPVEAQSAQATPAPDNVARARATELRLAAIDAYAEIVERPLFRKTRRPPEPEPETAGEQPEETPAEDLVPASERYVLIGVIMTPGKDVALLKDLLEGNIERVVDGQQAGAWSIAAIRSDRVSLRRGERVEDLELVRGEIPPAASEVNRNRTGRRRVQARQPSARNKVAERNRALQRKKALERRALQRKKARERKKPSA